MLTICIITLATTAIAVTFVTVTHNSCLWLFCFTFGVLLGYSRSYFQEKEFDSFSLFYNHPVDVIGRVKGIGSTSSNSFKYITTLSLSGIKLTQDKRWEYANGTIQLYSTYLPFITVDDTIRISTISLKQPKNGSFKSHLMRQAIHTTAFVKGSSMQRVFRPKYSLLRWIHTQKTAMLDSACKKLSPQAFALYSSVFLGNRSRCKNEVEQLTAHCRNWGILHYLARSGLHLVMFVIVWEGLLTLFPLHFLLKQLIVLFFVIIYFIFTWTSISFIRAFSVFVLYKLCNLLCLPINIFYTLCLVCFVILVINPTQLFFLDFQLRFALTAGLIWFNQLYNKSTAK